MRMVLVEVGLGRRMNDEVDDVVQIDWMMNDSKELNETVEASDGDGDDVHFDVHHHY